MRNGKKNLVTVVVAMFAILCFNTTAFAATVSYYIGEPVESCEGIVAAATRKVDLSIVEEINKARIANGLAELTENAQLDAAASVRAEECNTLFSHTRPDGSDWYTVDPAVCYGEILAEGYSRPAETVGAWMNSDVHRDVILTQGYKTIGYATYTNSEGYVYTAVEFGY